MHLNYYLPLLSVTYFRDAKMVQIPQINQHDTPETFGPKY